MIAKSEVGVYMKKYFLEVKYFDRMGSRCFVFDYLDEAVDFYNRAFADDRVKAKKLYSAYLTKTFIVYDWVYKVE